MGVTSTKRSCHNNTQSNHPSSLAIDVHQYEDLEDNAVFSLRIREFVRSVGLVSGGDFLISLLFGIDMVWDGSRGTYTFMDVKIYCLNPKHRKTIRCSEIDVYFAMYFRSFFCNFCFILLCTWQILDSLTKYFSAISRSVQSSK